MRRIPALLLLLLLAPLPIPASVNFSSGVLYNSSGQIANAFPMTVGGWAKISSLTVPSQQTMIVSGRPGSGGWNLDIVCTSASGCTCSAGGQIHFTKLRVVDICSAQQPDINAWNYIAAVVTSTKVHFFKMTASGTITTDDVNESSAFRVASSPFTDVGPNTTIAAPSGSMARIAVWPGIALTDAELKKFAYHGRHAIGQIPPYWWELSFPNAGASTNKQGDLGTLTQSMGAVSGVPTLGPPCPCSDPFEGK